jgi:cytochrome c oxidase subunit 4
VAEVAGLPAARKSDRLSAISFFWPLKADRYKAGSQATSATNKAQLPMTDHAPNSPSHEAHGSTKLYLGVFLALCALTGASFFTYSDYWPYHDRPEIGWAFMMAVSCTKALLVVLFFMHLVWEAKWKYVLTLPAMFLAVFLVLMLVPDIGLRLDHASRERWMYMALPEAAAEELEHASPVQEVPADTAEPTPAEAEPAPTPEPMAEQPATVTPDPEPAAEAPKAETSEAETSEAARPEPMPAAVEPPQQPAPTPVEPMPVEPAPEEGAPPEPADQAAAPQDAAQKSPVEGAPPEPVEQK